MFMWNGLRKIFKGLVLLLLFPLLYFITAFLFSYFPSSSTTLHNSEKVIYLSYNDTHSDIILSLQQVPPKYHHFFETIHQNKKGYFLFGWGDKETFLNTPTWDDLQVSTALKALFINTPSVMHVQYFSTLKRLRHVKSIQLSNEQVEHVIQNIFSSFDFSKKAYHGYGRNDLFYNSPYPYNLFNTCNTWTGDQLRHAGVSMSYWTPLSSNIITSLP